MRVAIVQSCYVPWRGYFDLIASVDRFILYDDVQYSKGTWRNRNQLKLEAGLAWMTVPVTYSFGQPISAVRISGTQEHWAARHFDLLFRSLGGAPYYRDVIALWSEVMGHQYARLSALNAAWTKAICRYLGIATAIEDSNSYVLEGRSTDRLLSLLQQVGAKSYLSGPSAQAYLELNKFRERGIQLLYKTYEYEPYPQQWQGYAAAVTVLDLIGNCGPGSLKWLRSNAPDEIVVP